MKKLVVLLLLTTLISCNKDKAVVNKVDYSKKSKKELIGLLMGDASIKNRQMETFQKKLDADKNITSEKRKELITALTTYRSVIEKDSTTYLNSLTKEELVKINSIANNVQVLKLIAATANPQPGQMMAYAQKTDVTKLDKNRVATLNNIDGIMGYSTMIKQNAKNYLASVEKQLASTPGGKDKLKKVKESFEANMEKQVKIYLAYIFRGFKDDELSSLHKTLNDKTYKSFNETTSKMQLKGLNSFMKVVQSITQKK